MLRPRQEMQRGIMGELADVLLLLSAASRKRRSLKAIGVGNREQRRRHGECFRDLRKKQTRWVVWTLAEQLSLNGPGAYDCRPILDRHYSACKCRTPFIRIKRLSRFHLPYPHGNNFNGKLHILPQPVIIICGLRDQSQEHE